MFAQGKKGKKGGDGLAGKKEISHPNLNPKYLSGVYSRTQKKIKRLNAQKYDLNRRRTIKLPSQKSKKIGSFIWRKENENEQTGKRGAQQGRLLRTTSRPREKGGQRMTW